MNYLAHLLLSSHSSDAILGALYGDFVKGSIDDQFTPAIRAGIALHRAIDRYTDAHPITAAARTYISPVRRRFASILIDVFYDHFLAHHWQRYCDIPLPAFAQHVYAILLTHQHELPQRLQAIVPYMATNNWLVGYADIHGIDAAINGIARRLKRHPRAAALHGGSDELVRNQDAFEGCFHEFFPQLVRYVRERSDTTTPGHNLPNPQIRQKNVAIKG